MLPVPIDAPLRYRRGIGIADATSPISRGCALVNSSPSTIPFDHPLRPRCLELGDDSNGILRLRPHSVVAVDVRCPDPSLLVDNLAGRHRQSKVGLMPISLHFSRR